MTSSISARLLKVMLPAALMVGLLAQPVFAQERPAAAVEFAAGALLFPDEGVVTEGALGGAGRFYLTPRMSIGPELTFVSGENHSHLMLTGNVTFDLVGPTNGQPRAVTPFVTVGGGIFRTREEFPFEEIFWSTEGTFTAGGGVRALVGRHVFVGAEARVGWELHIRLNGTIGILFGG